MTGFLTVRAFDRLDHGHSAALASLPASFRLIESGKADIAIAAPDWAAVAAALATSPKALVVTRPALLDDAAIEALDATTIAIFPSLALAARLAAINGSRTQPTAGLVRSRLAWHGNQNETMLEHLAGLEMVLGPLSRASIVATSSNGHIGAARTGSGIAVSWSGQSDAGRPEYELDIVGLADRLEVTGELDGSARPLLVRHGDAAGLYQPHGTFETGYRRFWQAIASDFAGNLVASRWRDFARLHALVRGLAITASMQRDDAA